MENSLIVNVSFGSWYPNGQKRLEESFRSKGYTGDFLMIRDEIFNRCPSHKDVPYMFKTVAMMEAMKLNKYKYLFWIDSAIQLAKPLDDVYKYLNEDGYYFITSGQQSLGLWSSDHSIKSFGITREESFTMPELASSVLGFNMEHIKSQQFISLWHLSALAGVFNGSKTNNNNEIAADSRVKGHRQDQTAATLIAHLLGMSKFHATLVYKALLKTKMPDEMIFVSAGGY